MIPLWFRREIREGDSGSDVDIVVRRLGLLHRSTYDATTAAVVKGMGLKFGIKTDGEVNAEIAEAIGESEANKARLLPEWFLIRDDDALRILLGVDKHTDLVRALKRWQGTHGFKQDGLLTAEQALHLGE